MLRELEGMSVRVDSARDQAVILMTSRGPACRELVEPKLADLNRNFHKVAQHINSAQVRCDRLSGGPNGAAPQDRHSLASTKCVCVLCTGVCWSGGQTGCSAATAGGRRQLRSSTLPLRAAAV